MATKVGANCLLMIGAHVAHDCELGDNVTLVNGATLGGHVTIGEGAIIGGLSAVHQFVRIGAYAFVGGMSGIAADVIPFGMAIGNRANLCGLNIVGLKRKGFPREQIHELRQAYRMLFSSEGTLKERLEDVETCSRPTRWPSRSSTSSRLSPIARSACRTMPQRRADDSAAAARARAGEDRRPARHHRRARSAALRAGRLRGGAGASLAHRRHSRRGARGDRALSAYLDQVGRDRQDVRRPRQ